VEQIEAVPVEVEVRPRGGASGGGLIVGCSATFPQDGTVLVECPDLVLLLRPAGSAPAPQSAAAESAAPGPAPAGDGGAPGGPIREVGGEGLQGAGVP
jgi:hypothetical protein